MNETKRSDERSHEDFLKQDVPLLANDLFVGRHLGPRPDDVVEMLSFLGLGSLVELTNAAVPEKIRTKRPLQIGEALSESESLTELRQIASTNQIFRNFIGMGYSGTFTPPVIQRNILENPGWYTQYTPYQAEIAQGRLEALLNFQTMIMDLTGMEIANGSLLDEATAAAEAMSMCLGIFASKRGAKALEGRAVFFVSEKCHPQTIQVVRTRAEPVGVEVHVGNHETFEFNEYVVGALVQYPATNGEVFDYSGFTERAHDAGALVVVAADLLALTLLKAPGEFGADIAVGNTQRFGVPMGFGGPHAAFLATRDQFKRQIPGRLVGVSKDRHGRPAVRLALQTREQHIRRDKATSNICTAQVLLAIMASMYAVYHGPQGLRRIALRTYLMTELLKQAMERLGHEVLTGSVFDTIWIAPGKTRVPRILAAAKSKHINLRLVDEETLGVSLDETTDLADVQDLAAVFSVDHPVAFQVEELAKSLPRDYAGALSRQSDYLLHPVFNRYHSETEMLRYIRRLESRDLSLVTSMIPLGSCTMKLNATAEMFPVTWPQFGAIHPFAPSDQAKGYAVLHERLEKLLAEITGLEAVSLQPNAGSQGEYAGLLVIRKYHHSRGEGARNICLIPQSAHGTNPASAAMAGMKIVVVRCDTNGNIDVDDLRSKAREHSKSLSALMVTYPSTHGVFEESIVEICKIIHDHGGQVYMDGANMNAQVGVCRPGEYGADVMHLNLHKTFCIPHGGGGPGMGPIAVAKHLTPFLPGHPVVRTGGAEGVGAIAAAPWGSPSILPISYSYIRMMGSEGLRLATEIAILNANYVAKKLHSHYPVLYRGKNGLVAHECIIDLRPLKAATGVDVEDVAKRLMDYGFHAPTVSFPVPGTMMIEPTESESLEELNRFCEAMISIREEIAEIEKGKADRSNNLLKNAPHTAAMVTSSEWTFPYPRERAAFPARWLRDHKFWPPVSRIDAVYGERNLVCACPPIEEWEG